MATPEPTSVRRCGLKLHLMWQRVDARVAPCLDLELVCGGTRSSGFTTLPPVPLQEQPTVVLLLEEVLVSWSLAMNECGGYEDLRDSGHQSLPFLSLPFCPPMKRRLLETFIAQG
jgi:hypothetical protein